jgi:hypothetical protein
MTKRTVILTVIGFGLLYLASFNTVLALVAGTCTQGDAGRLFGGVYSTVLILIALALLLRARPPRLAFLAVLPVLPVLAWQSKFAARMFAGHFIHGVSACDVLEDTTGYSMDGNEAFYALLWVGMSILLLGGLATVFFVVPGRGYGQSKSDRVV